jgi:hypothetical protein
MRRTAPTRVADAMRDCADAGVSPTWRTQEHGLAATVMDACCVPSDCCGRILRGARCNALCGVYAKLLGSVVHVSRYRCRLRGRASRATCVLRDSVRACPEALPVRRVRMRRAMRRGVRGHRRDVRRIRRSVFNVKLCRALAAGHHANACIRHCAQPLSMPDSPAVRTLREERR